MENITVVCAIAAITLSCAILIIKLRRAAPFEKFKNEHIRDIRFLGLDSRSEEDDFVLNELYFVYLLHFDNFSEKNFVLRTEYKNLLKTDSFMEELHKYQIQN